MKNQREIYKALLAGETLVDSNNTKLRLNDAGILINAKTGEEYSWVSGHPDIWQIYKEPKWYENIPDGGVLCWCWDNHQTEEDRRVFGIGDYRINMGAKFRILNIGAGFDIATPLTKQEIKVFMDNAPE